MNDRKPFFSVVMPTYNRADLLGLAVRSILDQSFEDFEIVISNGGSTDNTKEVVAAFDDSRVRYIESAKRLSIGDNYQAGLNCASGEYITFLGDDDAFAPTMFERVKRVIDERNAPIVSFRVCHYYHDDDIEFNYENPISANTLVIPKCTGKLTEFKKNEAAETLFTNFGLIDGWRNPNFIVPYLANAVYHHRIFSDIKQKREKMFALTPADMYLAAAVFFVSDSYFCLDEPLHVWSRWAGNSTASLHRKGDQLRAHYEKLLGGQTLDQTPLKFALPHNLSVNALLQAKYDFVENTPRDFRVNQTNYYVSVYDELLNLKSKKIDVSSEISEFQRALAAESSELQNKVRAEISNFKFVAKQFVRNKMPFIKNIARRLIKGRNVNSQSSVRGNEASFKNFLEAARFLPIKKLPTFSNAPDE